MFSSQLFLSDCSGAIVRELGFINWYYTTQWRVWYLARMWLYFFFHCNSEQTETLIINEAETRKLIRTASADASYLSIAENQWICRSKIPLYSLFGG